MWIIVDVCVHAMIDLSRKEYDATKHACRVYLFTRKFDRTLNSNVLWPSLEVSNDQIFSPIFVLKQSQFKLLFFQLQHWIFIRRTISIPLRQTNEYCQSYRITANGIRIEERKGKKKDRIEKSCIIYNLSLKLLVAQTKLKLLVALKADATEVKKQTE